MMKKIILSILACTCCAPVFAQQTFYEGFVFPNEQIVKKVKLAVKNARSNEKVLWAKAVRQEEQRANYNGPLGGSMYGFPMRTFKQEICQDNQRVYQLRVRVMQGLLKSNHTLSAYKFRATHPSELAGLNTTQIQFLYTFLRQPLESAAFNTQYTPKVSHPRNAETQLTFDVDGDKLILLINSRPEEKTVYFFLNEVK